MRPELVWLVGYLAALASGVTMIVTGAYLLRKVVEDLSNSLEWKSYVLRAFRTAPGMMLLVWGAILVTIMVVHVSAVPFSIKTASEPWTVLDAIPIQMAP
ncbi:hypothetical protein [Bradyrhizobium sp. MOS003]|jgi:uncharacterized membrane protein|uniref:hypothetical protein n=1 Tax=Bradyrhizobium sp. MOS003 TaxID=2133946 RepID=UPI000D135CA6|nr:hypothetical protein [Bradyrhizobium sp. MOS003]PSO20342.1 hypothetical protein C7G42_01040 [Bradyrhizobium sp. MOS003]